MSIGNNTYRHSFVQGAITLIQVDENKKIKNSNDIRNKPCMMLSKKEIKLLDNIFKTEHQLTKPLKEQIKNIIIS